MGAYKTNVDVYYYLFFSAFYTVYFISKFSFNVQVRERKISKRVK